MTRGFLLDLPNLPSKPGCTFRTPPLDGSLTIPELFDWHLEHNPTHPVFVYDSATGTEKIRFSTLVPAIRKLARGITIGSRETQCGDIQGHVHGTVGILAWTDTVTYFCFVVAMMYAGIPVLPISPRHSAEAIAHLLEAVDARQLFVSEDLQDLANRSLDIVKGHGSGHDVTLLSAPSYIDLFGDPCLNTSFDIPRLDEASRYTRPVIYVHSSGSSSLPKPIAWNHASLLQVALTPYLGAFDLRGEVFAGHAVPMFHASGLNYIPWVAGTGFVMAIHPPNAPFIFPTPDNLLSGIIKSNAAFLVCVPVFLEVWAKDEHAIQALKSLKAVAFGGGPLSKATGDHLVAQGVRLITVFGSTEAGVISDMFSEYQAEDWQYFSVNRHCAAYFEPADDKHYELTVVKRPTQVLTVTNTIFKGDEAYSTSDLFYPHPTKPGLWKSEGRADDQITLTSGSKINPGPLEAILCQHPLVEGAIIFGTGRFQAGVIIFPKSECIEKDQVTPEFLDKVRGQVEVMNRSGPRQARVLREMILLASPDRPLLTTNKGTIRRSANLASYKQDIEALYQKYESNTTNGSVILDSAWSFETAVAFVRKTVLSILPAVSEDDTNLFVLGCDSIQATWIGMTIKKALQSVALSDTSQSMVYRFPTIASLANRIVEVSRGSVNGLSPDNKTDELNEVTSRFIHFEQHQPNLGPNLLNTRRAHNGMDVFLITGTTGSLGCHMLDILLRLENVAQIYVLIRGSPTEHLLQKRQDIAFEKHGLTPPVEGPTKVKYIKLDLQGDRLNIDPDVEYEILSSVTHIYHLAWPVNFNMSLASFDEALRYLKALMNLALKSKLLAPPRFIFAGSIGTFTQSKDTQPMVIPDDYQDNPNLVSDTGYSQSKWVAEKMLEAASKTTSLRPIIMRLGQLSGSSGEGAWNVNEWFPAMVKTSIALRCLPDAPGVISWIPVDIAARAMLEMRNASLPVLHVVHPNPVPYSSIVDHLSDILLLPSRPFVDWVNELRLQQCDMGAEATRGIVQRLPALKLIDFFVQVGSRIGTHSAEAFVSCNVEHSTAAGQTESLRNAPSIGRAEVLRWIDFWNRVQYF